MTVVIDVVRFLLAGTLAFSAISKLLTFVPFADSLGAYWVPAQLRRGAAGTVILSETVIACLIGMNEETAVIGLLGATILLFVFSVALIMNLMSAAPSACFCFGRTERPVSWFDLGRNGGLMVLAVLGLVGSLEQIPMDSGLISGTAENSLRIPFVGVVLGFALAIVWSRFGSVIELFRGDIVELFKAD